MGLEYSLMRTHVIITNDASRRSLVNVEGSTIMVSQITYRLKEDMT